jgi:hypothetical protein
VAKNPTITEPVDQGVGPPPSRPADIMLVEIAKIQSDGEYIKRDLGELRSDMRELRDRMAKIEVKVDHLPSKGHMAIVVTTGLVIAVGLATAITGLQNYLAATKQLTVQSSAQLSK